MKYYRLFSASGRFCEVYIPTDDEVINMIMDYILHASEEDFVEEATILREKRKYRRLFSWPKNSVDMEIPDEKYIQNLTARYILNTDGDSEEEFQEPHSKKTYRLLSWTKEFATITIPSDGNIIDLIKKCINRDLQRENTQKNIEQYEKIQNPAFDCTHPANLWQEIQILEERIRQLEQEQKQREKDFRVLTENFQKFTAQIQKDMTTCHTKMELWLQSKISNNKK